MDSNFRFRRERTGFRASVGCLRGIAEVRAGDRATAAPAPPRPSDRWHLDEMVVRIAGERLYLWRAVDDEGEVLDMVQRRRDTRSALRLMRKLLKKQDFVPKLLVTDSCAPMRARSDACD
jgi:transposase-like protein